MGAFGIFVLVLTLLYIIYYIGMISYDLGFFGKSKNPNTVSVVVPSENPRSDEITSVVEETTDGGYNIKKGVDVSEAYSNQPEEKVVDESQAAAELEAANASLVADKMKEVSSELQSPEVHIEGSQSATEHIDSLSQSRKAAEADFKRQNGLQ
jgi:hypothetical protein